MKLYYTHLADNHQGPGLPLMLVMGNCMHLSERIGLMSKIRAVGFVAPMLDPRNVGVNAAGGVGDEVSNVALVGACAARAAESKGDSVGGIPQL